MPCQVSVISWNWHGRGRLLLENQDLVVEQAGSFGNRKISMEKLLLSCYNVFNNLRQAMA